MSDPAALSDLDLAALVSSRICHDVISPVGAIANGLELLNEETDEGMRTQALDLIRKSATQASNKLQFARLAFGAAGSAGAEIDLRDAEKVTRGLMEGGKHRVSWHGPVATLPKDKVKLLLNLISVGIGTLPRGGEVAVAITGEGPASAFELRCKGDHAKLNERVTTLLQGRMVEAIDAHSVQPYYAARIAKSARMDVEAMLDGADVVLRAVPSAAPAAEAAAPETAEAPRIQL